MCCRLLFVLCVALVLGSQAQVVVYFNNSYDCASRCYINDPLIYEGRILPTGEDEVIFNITAQLGITLVVPNNTVFNVSELSVFGFNSNLIVESNATLDTIELSLENVFLHVQEHGTIKTHEEASIEGNSAVVTSGSIISKDISFETTALIAYNLSVFWSESFEFDNASIEVYEGSSFNSSETEFSDSLVFFFIRPYLGDADFERVDAYFPVGFYVENEYLISSSNFTAYFPDELSNVTLVLAGKNNLTISNLIFAPNKIRFNNTGSPFMTFTVSNNASFNGTLDVPGEIVVNSGSSVVFNGSISLTGGIQANVDRSTHIQAFGTLSTGAEISLSGHNGTSDFTIDSAILNTPSLKLEKFALKALAGTTHINGSVHNDGSIQIYGKSNVVIHGNYTQVLNATFELVELENTATVSLFVNGSANITGDIKYSAAETKKSFTAVVLQAHPLSGKFETEAFTGDASDYSTKLDYTTPNQVRVTIDPAGTHEFLGLYWWVWVIIGVGVLTVLISIVVIVRWRKRSQYQAVSSR